MTGHPTPGLSSACLFVFLHYKKSQGRDPGRPSQPRVVPPPAVSPLRPYLHFGPGNSLWGGCPGPCRMLSGIPGPHPLDVTMPLDRASMPPGGRFTVQAGRTGRERYLLGASSQKPRPARSLHVVPRTVTGICYLKVAPKRGAERGHGWDWISRQESATPAHSAPLIGTPATGYTWLSRHDLSRDPFEAGFLTLSTSDTGGQRARRCFIAGLSWAL